MHKFWTGHIPMLLINLNANASVTNNIWNLIQVKTICIKSIQEWMNLQATHIHAMWTWSRWMCMQTNVQLNQCTCKPMPVRTNASEPMLIMKPYLYKCIEWMNNLLKSKFITFQHHSCITIQQPHTTQSMFKLSPQMIAWLCPINACPNWLTTDQTRLVWVETIEYAWVYEVSECSMSSLYNWGASSFL